MPSDPIGELKPCPFCGHAAYMVPPNEDRPEWYIECGGYQKESRLVNCPGPTIEHADQAVAIELWNRRAESPELAAFVEAAEEYCRVWIEEARPIGAGTMYKAYRALVRSREKEVTHAKGDR